MKGRDMTQGNIWKQLALFALPLLLGNLLQQAYNAFDAIVVGNFVSSDALASVTASAPFINIIVSFFMGMSSGASVLVSQYFGARDARQLKNTVHTAMLLSVILGVLLSVIGFIFTPNILEMMETPPEIMADAVAYLRIYFAGMVSLTIYNMGAAILTATGDSKRPLYFLILSTILNVGLNLLAVLTFHMGVAGVAYATVVSQVICAILVVLLLCKAPIEIRLQFKRLRFHRDILKTMFRIGIPGGVQGTIISFSNASVQRYINLLGTIAVSGYGASSRLDGFISMPVAAMTLAVSTFVGQNLGAGQVKRARKGVVVSMIMGTACSLILSAVVLLTGSSALRIFSEDPDVLVAGVEFLKVLSPWYFLLGFTQILPGALRGAGDVNFATFASVGSFVVIRQIYLFFITKNYHSIFTVALGYPTTWFLAAAVLFIYYLKSNWSKFERKNAEESAIIESTNAQ